MTFSKPCERAGCSRLATAPKLYILQRKKYCSVECQVAAKKANGWQPDLYLNAENRRRGGVASARRTQTLQHRRKLEQAVRDCVDLIPADLQLELSARALALFKVLLGRAFERGRRREHTILLQQRRRQQAQKGAAA